MPLRFHVDAGHGWLEVPVGDVIKSGAKISTFSYCDPASGLAFLEEDCDATAFAEKFGGWNGVVEQYGGIEDVDDGDYSFIRNLPPYRTDLVNVYWG